MRAPALLRRDPLLAILLAAFPLLLWAQPGPTPDPAELWAMVDGKTLGALAGLMILSRGLEESGSLGKAGGWVMGRVCGERALAGVLVLFGAFLSAVVTNDVALFITVPLVVALGRSVRGLRVVRHVVFQALAVNAGSAASPVGNPQNLFLWQTSGVPFPEFLAAMLPLGAALVALLLALVPLAFPAGPFVGGLPEVPEPARNRAVGGRPSSPGAGPELHRGLMTLCLLLYPVFLAAVELGRAPEAALMVLLLFLGLHPRVLRGVDWLLLTVFLLMFLDLGLLALLPAVQEAAGQVDRLPGGVFTAGVLLSQAISNVPAALLLEAFTSEWRPLAWGVSVGGFGLAIGSLANLIALRLARQPGGWVEFHRWSLPVLAAAWGLALVLGP